MNAELIIKNLEKNIRKHFGVKGDFRAVFYYAEDQENIVTFDIIDSEQKIRDTNNIFAIVGTPRDICWYHGKNFWELINLYSTIRGYSTEDFNEHEMGCLVAECLNYYYRLYATLPPQLYYVH